MPARRKQGRRVNDSPLPGDQILDLERRVLRAMCQLAPDRSGPLGPEPMRRLAGYLFRDPVHQEIFNTLGELRKIAAPGSQAWPATVREHLASRLTLRGFPDFDIEILFSGESIDAGELRRCISRLTGTPEGK